MKGSGGLKKSPPSPGRKNPPVPRTNQQRSSSNSRDKRCSSPTGKCKGNRSPSTSSKRTCSKPVTQPARKQFSPIRGASTTRKVTVTPVKSKKQAKKRKPSPPEKITQTTSSLITGEHKMSVLDADREIEHILATDARSREGANLVPTISGEIRIPSGNASRTELKPDKSGDMICVTSTMVTQLSKRLSSRENEYEGLQSNDPKQSREMVKEIEEFPFPPSTSEDSDENTLDIHIASLRNLINTKNLQNDNYSIVSQLKGSSVISTGEGHVTISTGDKRITISSIEGPQIATSSEGSGNTGEQLNFTTAASGYSQPAPEPNVVKSNHVKRKVSTIIIESKGPCYSNNDEETRERIIQNDPTHPLARKTLSSPARSDIPLVQKPTSQLPIVDIVSPTNPPVHAQEDNKSKLLQTFTSSGRDYDLPPRQPETTASDVSKFVLEVDLNKSIINPEFPYSIISKFAVPSIRSQFESGSNVDRPCKEEEEGKDEKVKGEDTNKPTVCKSPVDVNICQKNSLRYDEAISQRFYKPMPLISSESKTYPAVSRTWNMSKTANDSEVTPDQDVPKAREGIIPHLGEIHSIKEFDPLKKETCKSEESTSKKIWESKEISNQSKTKHSYDIWETRDRKSRQDNIEYAPTAIGSNFDSTAMNSFAGTSIRSSNGNRRPSSPPATNDFRNFASNGTDIVNENKENEIRKRNANFNDSIVVNDRKEVERTQFIIGNNSFSNNDILIPQIGGDNKTFPHSETSDRNIRIEKKASEKTVGSYITVKESKSFTISAIDTKIEKYGTDHIARRQYFDVKDMLGVESGQRLDTANLTNDSRRFEVRGKREQIVRKPSGGTYDKSETKQWEETDEVEIKFTEISLNQSLSQTESSNWVANDDNVLNPESKEELEKINPDISSL